MIEIDIRAALKNEGECGTFHFEGVPDFGKEIDFSKPLVLDAEFCVIDRRVSVKGSFEAILKMACDRCLCAMETEVKHSFSELFWPSGTQKEEEYTYTGEQVSLDKMVYDAIVLSLPTQLLCKEDCKGICPKCGHNLNEGQCGCKADDTDDTNPFTKLKGLF